MIEKIAAIARSRPVRISLVCLAAFALLLWAGSKLGGCGREPDPEALSRDVAEKARELVRPADPERYSPPRSDTQRVWADYREDLKKSGEKKEDFEWYGTKEDIRERRQWIDSHLGLYDLPFHGSLIYAEYLETSQSGQYVIRITYTGPIETAQMEWEGYLRRHGDKPSNYVAIFEPGNPDSR